MLFGHLVWDLLDLCVGLIPIPPVTYHQGSTDLCLLHHFTHHHWSNFWVLHLATNLILIHITTCCIQKMSGMSLFWSIQSKSPEDCSAMVLTWWQTYCPPHIHYCGLPRWMVYFPSLPFIPSIYSGPPWTLTKSKTLKPKWAWCSLI